MKKIGQIILNCGDLTNGNSPATLWQSFALRLQSRMVMRPLLLASRRYVGVLLLLFISICSVWGQESGAFLKIPISPVAGGMGDSFVSLSNDSYGMYYNPAGIGFIKNPVIGFIHHSYVQDINGNSISFVYPFKNWAIGLGGTSFSMEREPIYDSFGNDTGREFDYESEIFPISVAYMMRNFAMGFSIKLYQEWESGENTKDITTFDLGAIYQVNKFRFGYASQNMVGDMYNYPLVKVQRLGVAYNAGKYLFSADIKKEGESGSSVNAGAEIEIADILKLRGGYRFKEDFGGMTFGLGLKLGNFNFDYAFLDYGDLGKTHKAGISLNFGKSKPEVKEEKKVEKIEEKPFVSNPPELLWTGEENYASAGVYPESGNTTTNFIYRVKYADIDNDPPANGYPKLHIKKRGAEISGSPFVMEYVSGENKTGAIYSYSTRLAAGNDYSYYFEAKDSGLNTGKGIPTNPVNGPVVSQVETPKISGGMNIAVSEFTGKNVSQADASIVSDFLRTELVNTGAFNVMDRNNMDTILAEQKFQASGCTEQECAVKIGKILNVREMIVGSLSKLLDTYYITVNVVDVETGKIITSMDSSAKSSTELREACREIAKKLVR